MLFGHKELAPFVVNDFTANVNNKTYKISAVHVTSVYEVKINGKAYTLHSTNALLDNTSGNLRDELEDVIMQSIKAELATAISTS